MRNVCVLGLLALLLSGCTSYQALLDGLESRNVSSCVWFNGSAGPYASLRVVTATGQAELAKCMQQ